MIAQAQKHTQTHTQTQRVIEISIHTHIPREEKQGLPQKAHSERASESFCLASGYIDKSIFFLLLSGRMGMKLERVIYGFSVLFCIFDSYLACFCCFPFSICHDLNVTFDRLSIKQMIWWIIRLLLNVAVVRLMFGHFSQSFWSFRSSFTFIFHPSILLNISTSAHFPYAVVQTFCINSYLAKTNIALPIGPFSFLSLQLPVLHLFLAQLHFNALSHLTSTHSFTGHTRPPRQLQLFPCTHRHYAYSFR